MVYRRRHQGQGLGGGDANLISSFDRQAIGTLNKVPMLRPKILHSQRSKA